MGAQDYGGALRTQFGDEAEEQFLVERIESTERFIENRTRRCVQHGGGKLHLLLIALGELFDFVFRAGEEFDAIEPVLGGALCCVVIEPAKRAEVREHRDEGHVLIESALFRQVSE